MSEQRGFTLVEVLVVLVLTGILMVSLFSTFRSGAMSWQTAERFVEQTEEERQLVNLLHRHMRQVVTASYTSGNLSENMFSGEDARLRYVAPLSLSAASRPYLVELASGLNGNVGTWIRFAPFRPGVAPDELLAGAEALRLSENLELSFSYFDAGEKLEEGQGGEGWVSYWGNRSYLPALLGLELVGEHSRMPPLVLAVVSANPTVNDPELLRALEILQGFTPAE